MKLLIHDLPGPYFDGIGQLQKEDTVISPKSKIDNCIGCYSCWLKTPTKCVIHDAYSILGEKFGTCDDLIIITNCYYGGYSPFVKCVLDRGLSYLLPYLEIQDGKSRHKMRYKKRIKKIQAYFYGEGITSEEKETAKRLLAANSYQFNVQSEPGLTFHLSVDELKGITL